MARLLQENGKAILQENFGAMILEVSAGPMTPAIGDYNEISYSSTGVGPILFPSITWLTGDVIVVIAGNDGTNLTSVGPPTVSGLTFTQLGTVGGNNVDCFAGAWKAKAASGSSGQVSVPAANNGDAAVAWGASLWRFTSATDVGNYIVAASGGLAVPTKSLTVLSHSAVIGGKFDFVPVDQRYTGTPTVNIERIDAMQGGARYGTWIADWLDQAAGTRNYGVTISASTKDAWVLVEVRG